MTATVESRLEIALRLLLEQCARFTRGEPSSKLVCGIGLSREPSKPQQAWSMFANCHQYRVLPPSDDTRCRRADTDMPRSFAARSSSGDGSQASVGAAVRYCRVVWARVAFGWWAERCDGSDFFLRSRKSTARASRKKKSTVSEGRKNCLSTIKESPMWRFLLQKKPSSTHGSDRCICWPKSDPNPIQVNPIKQCRDSPPSSRTP